ncbi:hypothetical protein FDA94_29460 [Herbidospora galbida]|uniref:Tyr recombinase domain-containing protein n=1 Tax=Herbidospora galbida TaxID=2575442 RepID=A0A4U3M7G9_9ACTN|nr:hypothetical protein FDA94_29460 [Herbidospora galbida]
MDGAPAGGLLGQRPRRRLVPAVVAGGAAWASPGGTRRPALGRSQPGDRRTRRRPATGAGRWKARVLPAEEPGQQAHGRARSANGPATAPPRTRAANGGKVLGREGAGLHSDGRQPGGADYLTYRFHKLVRESGLPPVRLHDLRHGAVTMALAAHVDLPVIQDQVGHASIVLTADTYTSVLPELQHEAARATARLVMSAAR